MVIRFTPAQGLRVKPGLPASTTEHEVWVDSQLKLLFAKLGGVNGLYVPANKRVLQWWARGAGSTTAGSSGSGPLGFSTGGTLVGVTLDAEGPRIALRTGAVIGNESSFSTESALRREYSPTLLVYLKLPSLADIRCFFGVTDLAQATVVGSDEPVGHIAGFQFSAPRGDTNWQYLTSNGTTTTVTNSGVAATTNAVLLAMRLDDSEGRAVLMVGESTQGLITATLPATGIAMRWRGVIETQAAAAKDLEVGYGVLITDK